MSLFQNTRTYIYGFIVIVLSFVALLSSQVLAQNTSINNSANVLKVSPVRTDVEIQPGTSKAVSSTVTNVTKSAITVRPVGNDFVAGDERGTPALVLNAGTFAPTHSLKRFMAPVSDVTIPAGETKTISVVVSVPKDAQAGGYFGALRFVAVSPEGTEDVNVSGSVASLILLKVPGDVVEKLNLTNFDIMHSGKSASYFQTANNIQAMVRFENKGNVQVNPFGKVSVKKGDAVIYEADFNAKDPRDMVLPDSARRWEIPLEKMNGYGKYTVSATFTYGQKNQTIEVTKSFWVIPQAIIIGAVTGLIAIIVLIIIIWIYFSRRRRAHRLHGRGHGGSIYKHR